MDLDEFERAWKEDVMVCFKVLTRSFPK